MSVTVTVVSVPAGQLQEGTGQLQVELEVALETELVVSDVDALEVVLDVTVGVAVEVSLELVEPALVVEATDVEEVEVVETEL